MKFASKKSKFFIQIIILVLIIAITQFFFIKFKRSIWFSLNPVNIDNFFLKIAILSLSLPLCIIATIGVLQTSFFSDKHHLRGSLLFVPFIKFRIKTNGNQPELLLRNVYNNMYICLKIGFNKFQIEIVSNKPIFVQDNPYVRVIGMNSSDYDSNFNIIYEDESWIILMNEDVVFTKKVLYDILNFSMINNNNIAMGTVITNEIEFSFASIKKIYQIGQNFVFKHLFLKFPFLVDSDNTFILCKNLVYNKILNGQKNSSRSSDIKNFLESIKNEGYSMDWIDAPMISRSLKLTGNFPNYSQLIFFSSLKKSIIQIIIYFCFAIFKCSFIFFFLSDRNKFEIIINFVTAINSFLFLIGYLWSAQSVKTNILSIIFRSILIILLLPFLQISYFCYFFYENFRKISKKSTKFHKIQLI